MMSPRPSFSSAAVRSGTRVNGVVGRALAFSDPEFIRLASEDYVPVAGDDWYQRRRNDAEGEFFRKVSDQGPRKNTDGSTRTSVWLSSDSRNGPGRRVMVPVGAWIRL